MRLILASASPRRAELLAAAGIPFEVRPADVDESVLPGEPADAYVRRVAREKALAAGAGAPRAPILGADTVVVADGEILGKPRDAEDARRMLRGLSGISHRVLTGVCLVPAGSAEGGDARAEVRVAATTVEFAALTDEEIAWYVSTGEPMDKAGAYAIQGFASRFVTRIDGSYSNVVGLPVALVYGMCRRVGLLLS